MVVLLILLAVVAIIVIVAVTDQKKHDEREADERKRRAEEYRREWQELQRENEELKRENEAWEKEFGELMTYQNRGMELEKVKDIEEAVKAYEEAVRYGSNSSRLHLNNYYHSIERLAICYRKQKRYQDEIDLLEFALELNPTDDMIDTIKHRIEKSKQLLNNQKIK